MSEVAIPVGGLSLPAELTETSLTLAPGTSFDEWLKLMDTLGRIDRAHQWWEGDALNQAEAAYGEKYAQAVEEGREDAAKAYAWVAGRVETTTRVVELSWNHHRVVARFDNPEEQRHWLAEAEREGWSYRELAKAIKKASITETGTVAGTYRVLYADPPWQYADDLIQGYGAAEHHYPTVTTDDLCDLQVRERPVAELAEDDAVLFLWATSPLLTDALAVIEAWGFIYKASFIWDKVRHNFGHYNSVRHEFLFIATRGSCTPQSEKLELHDSVVSIDRTTHSSKPEEFRSIIEGLYPEGARLELFARQENIAGWDFWGAV